MLDIYIETKGRKRQGRRKIGEKKDECFILRISLFKEFNSHDVRSLQLQNL